MKVLLPCSTHSASQATTFLKSRLRSVVLKRCGLDVKLDGAASIIHVSGEANHQVSICASPNGKDKDGEMKSKFRDEIFLEGSSAFSTRATNDDGLADG